VKPFKNYSILLIVSIVLLSLGYYFEIKNNQVVNQIVDVESFKNVLSQKQALLKSIVFQNKELFQNKEFNEIFKSKYLNIDKKLENEHLILLAFENDSLKFWSNNFISLDEINNIFSSKNDFIKTGNCWLVKQTFKFDNVTVLGIIIIKTEYTFENEFLENSVNRSFKLPAYTNFSNVPETDGFIITNDNGEFLLSIIPQFRLKNNSIYIFFSVLFYVAFFISFFIFLKNVLKLFRQKSLSIFILLLLMFLFRFILFYFKIPSIFYSLEIFDPKLFATSVFLPTLGDFLINVIFIFYLIIVLYNELFLILQIPAYKSYMFVKFIMLILISFIITIYLFSGKILESLVFDSSISLELNNILSINSSSIVAYIVISLLFFILAFITKWVVEIISNKIDKKGFYLTLIFSSAIFIFCCYLGDYKIGLLSVLLSVSVLLLFKILFDGYENKWYSYVFYFITIFVIYNVIIISVSSKEKEESIRKLLVTNLANERDPIAELQMSDFEKDLLEDKKIKSILQNDYSNKTDELYNYFINYYFHGFWRKYDIQLTICKRNDSLLINEANKLENCKNYFTNYRNNIGVQIGNTNFYFLDNINGRISYLAELDYIIDSNNSVYVYVELDSKLQTEQLGYPELLIENKIKSKRKFEGYSYAKFRDNRLVFQFGNFSYNLSLNYYGEFRNEFEFLDKDDFNHLIYKVNDNNFIVLSKPSHGIFNYIVFFSYLLVMYVILYLLILLFNINKLNIIKSINNLIFRIQITYIGIVLLSLFVIGGGTIYYNIKQFEKKQLEKISEKAQSILIELDGKFANEKSLLQLDSYNINYLLVKWSNVLYADINLYAPDGKLIASSRKEIFDKGLVGNYIDADAYCELAINKKSEYVHNEKIGKLEFLSAYVPFFNNDGEILAFVNLPYFTKEYVVRNEISSLIITIINIFIFLILITISLTLLVSKNITKPLRLIQNKMSEIELGKKNELINYNRKDEIGNLIIQYNRLVLELSESADKLAKSERESAWREMAKQIAHEIKNPLTPMKLSIQLLLKSWNDKDINWEQRFNKISQTLIEQIDSLSAIASEFSGFAQMPQSKKDSINLIDKIELAVNTFSNDENISITTNYNGITTANVFADGEQILRVFNNLLKNAIQAIPNDRKGIIIIRLSNNKNTIIFEISDNGKGISDSQKDKLFQPNFTTKTSGMGLGLAIVKNIVEGIGGRVWFETEENVGTSFFVEFKTA